MTTHDNAAPPPDWQPTARDCPIPCRACVSESPQHAIWLAGSDEHIVRGEN